MYVPKNKGESSSKETADLKSISIHPNLFAIIKETFITNEFFDLVPKSLIIDTSPTYLYFLIAPCYIIFCFGHSWDLLFTFILFLGLTY